MCVAGCDCRPENAKRVVVLNERERPKWALQKVRLLATGGKRPRENPKEGEDDVCELIMRY